MLYALPQESAELDDVIDVDDALAGFVALNVDVSAPYRVLHSVAAYVGEPSGFAYWNCRFLRHHSPQLGQDRPFVLALPDGHGGVRVAADF
jgi:hypothetical protein